MADPAYGVVASTGAQYGLDKLTPNQASRCDDAVSALKQNPTPSNPYVTALNWFPYQPGMHALVWGEIVLTYRVQSPDLIELFSVQIRPDLALV